METALWMPLLVLFFMGTVEFGRAAYTYYTLKKVLYNLGRYAGTQQGINFCDGSDAQLEAAKLMALTGNVDGTGDRLLPGLAPEQIVIRIERYLPESGTTVECGCDATQTGCDTSQGARGPDYISVSVPEGYPLQLRLAGIVTEPILLRTTVKLPFGGL